MDEAEAVIQLVMKPEKAPVVRHEGLYGMYMNGNLLLHVRARNARHAEEKVMFLMEKETSGKVLDFDLERFKKSENGKRPERDAPAVRPSGE